MGGDQVLRSGERGKPPGTSVQQRPFSGSAKTRSFFEHDKGQGNGGGNGPRERGNTTILRGPAPAAARTAELGEEGYWQCGGLGGLGGGRASSGRRCCPEKARSCIPSRERVAAGGEKKHGQKRTCRGGIGPSWFGLRREKKKKKKERGRRDLVPDHEPKSTSPRHVWQVLPAPSTSPPQLEGRTAIKIGNYYDTGRALED